MDRQARGAESVRDMVMDALIDEGWGVIDALEEANKWIREVVARGPGDYTYTSKRHTIDITIGGKA